MNSGTGKIRAGKGKARKRKPNKSVDRKMTPRGIQKRTKVYQMTKAGKVSNSEMNDDLEGLFAKMDHIANAAEWTCECGAKADPHSSAWRWDGQYWQHSHGQPYGHSVAIRKRKV